MSETFTWGADGTKVSPSERRRRVAEALMAKGADASPVQHWTQGAARVLQAMYGAMQLRDADAAEKAGLAEQAGRNALLMGGGGAPVATAAPSPTADPSAAVAAIPAALAPVFTTKEAEYKLPSNYLPQVAKIESSFNPSAANPNSSARGLFQFTKGTARDYGLANPMDPIASTDAAARLAADNAKTLTNVLGRAPTAGELYLAHQQGGGGAAKLLANPNARAIDVVGRDAVINNGGNANMTAAEFARRWTSKVAANEADLPAQDAAVAEAPGTAPGFAIPPAPAPAMDGATFNAIQSGQPLDPVFQTEGVSQPWMGTALAPAAPAAPPAPQVAQAPMPPPRPADLPAPGAVEAIGQAPVAAAPVAAAPAPIIADPTKDNAGVLSGLVASEEARKGLPSGAGIMSPFGGTAAPAVSPAATNDQSVFSRIASALGGGSAAPASPVAAPSPAVQAVASALPAQDASTPAAAPSAGASRVAAAMATLNSPYARPGERAVAQQIVQQAYRDPAKVEADKLDLDLKRKQLSKSDEPTAIQEYNLAVKQGETRSFTDWKTAQAKAGATSVSVNGGGSDKQIFDTFAENAKEARAAANGLVALREARAALAGGAITGAGADTKLGLQKIGAALGVVDPTNIQNTETFRAAIAPQVAAVLKSTVGSANISDSDRRFAEKAAGGSIELDAGSINRLLDIMEKAGTARLDLHQKQLDAVYPDPEGNKRERALFSVAAPPKPAPPAAAPDRAALEAEARRRGLIK